MKDLCLNVLGLQEARSPAGVTQAGNVLQLASRCAQGQHGADLWLNLEQPMAYKGKKPCFVLPSQVQILISDLRRLLVRLVNPCIE